MPSLELILSYCRPLPAAAVGSGRKPGESGRQPAGYLDR